MIMDDQEIVGNKAAAEYVGVAAASTWRAYVRREQAPAPDLPPRVEGGHALPVWRRATLDAWKEGRPGRGAPGRPRPTRAEPRES